MEIVSIIIALVALGVSVSIERLSIRQDREHYLDSVWRKVMDGVEGHPEFSDISKTENYLAEFDWAQRLRYDSFCIQAWTACYQLVDSGHRLSLDQRLAVEWMVAYHGQWLHGNAQLFTDRKFWKLIDEIEASDVRLTIHRPVPSVDGLATWDELLDRYFHTFLSPFDPRIPSERRFESILHFLLTTHSRKPNPLVVDLGCGIGTAFPTLEACTDQTIAVDINAQALQSAAKASNYSPALVHGDMRQLALRDGSADIVLAINSILMESREDNVQALAEIERVLKPGGIAVLMLPSYEAITNLRRLRVAEADEHGGDEYARRVAHAFDHLRQPDELTASYADDGVTRQYFHSRETIRRELASVDLDLIDGPTEFYYPWEVTRSFNYGFYPGEKEAWDWITVARKPREPSPSTTDQRFGHQPSSKDEASSPAQTSTKATSSNGAKSSSSPATNAPTSTRPASTTSTTSGPTDKAP